MVVVESDGACTFSCTRCVSTPGQSTFICDVATCHRGGCFEEVKSSRESRGDSWVQVGSGTAETGQLRSSSVQTRRPSGKGAYERVTSLKFVGAGKGSIDKERRFVRRSRKKTCLCSSLASWQEVVVPNRFGGVFGAVVCLMMVPVLIGWAVSIFNAC